MIEATLQRETKRPQRSRPQLGFAGLGWIGRNRMEAIAHSGRGDIAAIFEPAPEAAQQASGAAPDAAIVDHFEDLLARDLDGVVIATPNALHAPQAIAALERGCAVFCQKPLGRNAEETRRVIDAARAADRLLQVDLSYRHTTAMQKIRALARSGAFGRIYAIEAVFHNAYGPAKPWFYDVALAGGGCLLDLGIHLVDLALWALDFPAVSNVAGHLLHRAGTAEPNRQGEDYAAAQVLLEGGVSLQLACSWHAPAGCDAQIGLTFFGTEAGARFYNINGSFYDFAAELFLPDRSREVIVTPPDEWGGRAAVAWCRELAESAAFDPDIERLNVVAEALDRIYGRLP
jgi:predicted dehydrogenase